MTGIVPARLSGIKLPGIATIELMLAPIHLSKSAYLARDLSINVDSGEIFL
jgi:hypothetical protein